MSINEQLAKLADEIDCEEVCGHNVAAQLREILRAQPAQQQAAHGVSESSIRAAFVRVNDEFGHRYHWTATSPGVVAFARAVLALAPQPAPDEPAVRVAIDSGPGGVTCIINPDEPAAGQLSDAQILDEATRLFPMWRQDIQPRFVVEVARATLALSAAPHPPARGAQAEAGGSRHPKRSPDEWREIAALEDAAGGCVAAGSIATPQQAAGQADLVQVAKEDANNYSLLLTALGMEEEGDPVAEVKRLIALADDLRKRRRSRQSNEATPQPQRGAGEGLVPLSEGDVYFLIGTAHNPAFTGQTEIPHALLGVAANIAAAIGNEAMAKRCGELKLGIRPAGSEGEAS